MRNDSFPIFLNRSRSDIASRKCGDQRLVIPRRDLPAVPRADQIILGAVPFRYDDRQAVAHRLLHRQSPGSGQDEQVCFREIRVEFVPMLCPHKLRRRVDLLRYRL